MQKLMTSSALSSILCIGMGILITDTGLLAESITIEPVKDNTLYEEGVLSNGAGKNLYAGKTGDRANTQWRRALIQFDLSGIIPAGSSIDTVTLSMNVSKVPPAESSSARLFSLHLLTSDWGEGTSDTPDPEGKGTEATTGDATWLNAFHPSTPWNFEGGDFNFTPSASVSITGIDGYSWSNANMADDVQGWIDNPSTNFGWIILGPNVDKSARQFDSRENTNAANRPKLTITYTTPPSSWAGYMIESDGRTVDTGDYLGWIDIESKPWVYVYNLSRWTYLPESHVTEVGAWVHIP